MESCKVWREGGKGLEIGMECYGLKVLTDTGGTLGHAPLKARLNICQYVVQMKLVEHV